MDPLPTLVSISTVTASYKLYSIRTPSVAKCLVVFQLFRCEERSVISGSA